MALGPPDSDNAGCFGSQWLLCQVHLPLRRVLLLQQDAALQIGGMCGTAKASKDSDRGMQPEFRPGCLITYQSPEAGCLCSPAKKRLKPPGFPESFYFLFLQSSYPESFYKRCHDLDLTLLNSLPCRCSKAARVKGMATFIAWLHREFWCTCMTRVMVELLSCNSALALGTCSSLDV